MIDIVETGNIVANDPKVLHLVSELMNGRIEEINPSIDISRTHGVAYPQIEQMLDKSSEEVVKILDSLVEEGVLQARFYDRLIFCPVCNSMNLRPSKRCPKCGSGNVVKGRIIEHFVCGKNGLEDEFIAGGKYICPHCRKPLKFLGTDYRSIGVNHKCNHCGVLFADISFKWQCLKCSVYFADDEARQQTVFSYVLNENNRNWLTFDIGFKSKFIDYLKQQGYEVFEKARAAGGSGSGVNHQFDILARRDDGFLQFLLGIGIAVGQNNENVSLEDVFRFDNKAYDIGIHDKVLLAVPGFSSEAQQFARRQRIKTFDAKELAQFISGIENTASHPVTRKPFTYESRSKLLAYLHEQGYRIEENAIINGRSGAEYFMDIIAYFDDGLFTHTISIGILSGKEEIGLEAVSSYDTKAYDIGIHDKILIISPAVSRAARQFAEQQRIKIFEVESRVKSS